MTLHRATREDACDWVEENGRPYDAVGNFPPQYSERRWPARQGRIVDHLEKAGIVPVDVSQSTTSQAQQVRDFVESLPAAQREQIRLVGEQ